MVGLVQLLLKSNAANSLIEDYAACLELSSEESQTTENNTDDPGILIMQVSIRLANYLFWFLLSLCLIFLNCCLHVPSTCFQLLIDNISRPAPNITHLLLRFDLDMPVERTILQPKFYYRFLSVFCLYLIFWFL